MVDETSVDASRPAEATRPKLKSAKRQKALQDYLHMGPDRSLKRLAIESGQPTSVRKFETWSKKDGWFKKAEDWDRERAKERELAVARQRERDEEYRAKLIAKRQTLDLELADLLAERLKKQLALPLAERVTDRHGDVTVRQTKQGTDFLAWVNSYDKARRWSITQEDRQPSAEVINISVSPSDAEQVSE